MTNQASTALAEPRPGSPEFRRRAVAAHVAKKVVGLQQTYVTNKPLPGTVAALAQLRAAVTAQPGQHYAVLDHTTLADAVGDEPTDEEFAIHVALTLYAVHQQSIQDAPMHVTGNSVGAALGSMARTLGDQPGADRDTVQAPVRRRFAQLGAASTFDATVYHLRTLVRLLRNGRIPLDYVQLAEDLLTMRWKNGLQRVQAKWGRDFYRAIAPNLPNQTTQNQE